MYTYLYMSIDIYVYISHCIKAVPVVLCPREVVGDRRGTQNSRDSSCHECDES